MRNFTELQQKSYNHITTNEQLNQINNFVFDKLRLVQKNALHLIERNYIKNKAFNKEEKDYIFNLYYNFIINKFEFSASNKTIKVKGKNINTRALSHIGMRMLHNLPNS